MHEHRLLRPQGNAREYPQKDGETKEQQVDERLEDWIARRPDRGRGRGRAR